MPAFGNLRAGPAGWAYPSWEGLIYPRPAPRGFHPLSFLADRLDTVEITASFSRFVRPELARLWLSRVRHNERFQFTARLHREFTHERNLDPALVSRFAEGLLPLVERHCLGCVLMQFPFAFRFTAENKEFLIRLRRTFHRFPLVAELRHDSWTSQEAMGTLIDYHVGFANLDQPPRVRATPPTAILTTATGYVKLHGRRRGRGFWRFDEEEEACARNEYSYSLAELEEWSQRIAHLRRFAESVFVIFGNEGGGRSVVNALQLQGMLTGCPAGAESGGEPERSCRDGRPAGTAAA